jgi:hypothetical protein
VARDRVALLNGARSRCCSARHRADLLDLARRPLAIKLGMVIAAAMVINIATAGSPASRSRSRSTASTRTPRSPRACSITMITDSMGFLAFLGLGWPRVWSV